jgi:hypothetical protein
MTRLTRSEEGSALILALFFSIIFFVLLAAVVAFADVGLKSMKGFENQLRASASAEGAVDAAINRYRVDGTCGGGPAPMTPEVRPVGGKNVIVHCSATQSTNRPAKALSSRSTDPLEGIVSTDPGVLVRGDVFSNSTIRTKTGADKLRVQKGSISAIGTCDGDIDTLPSSLPLSCAPPGTGTADPIEGRDPDFTKLVDAVPMWRVAPDCPPLPVDPPPASRRLVRVLPGYYDDASKLSNLTNGLCPGAVVWLEPGAYYFNFGFAAPAPAPPAVWTITDPNVNVVAGTPRGWSVGAPDTVSSPGGCTTDGDPPPNNGVQLIMGGTSRIEVDSGASVELCAQPSSTEQQLALYGLAADHPDHTLEPTLATEVDGFRDSRNAFVIGESPVASAVARIAPSGPSTAALTLSGFRQSVPAGALIDGVTLRVAHQDEQTGTGAAAEVSFTGIGNTCSHNLVLHPVTIVVDTKDLKADCGVDTPAKLAALGITYTAKAGSSPAGPATDRLDGIWIDVSYRTPTTRKATIGVSSVFSTPQNAREIGEYGGPADAYAVAALSKPVVTSASLTVGGFGNPPIPSGSVIDSAKLLVAHQDVGDIEDGGVTVSVPDVGTCGDPHALELRSSAIGTV